MNTITKTIASLTIAIAAFSTAAHADQAPSKQINLSGYDLSNPAAVSTIKSRIHLAARDVCGFNQDDGLASRNAKQNCYRSAVTVALAKVEAQVAIANSNKATLSVR